MRAQRDAAVSPIREGLSAYVTRMPSDTVSTCAPLNRLDKSRARFRGGQAVSIPNSQFPIHLSTPESASIQA